MPRTQPNRLIHETSPYLLQHAWNPVDWYPWSEAALAQARAEDKPVLLSIGYSACHWCHVMAHESFENPEIADFMNAHFINIKVDREERPDLDSVYMDAVQLMTGSGGWPLTIFLTPDGRPFYGGTYFPPDDLPGRPGFPRILRAVAETYRQDPAAISGVTGRILDALNSNPPADSDGLSRDQLEQAVQALLEEFDSLHGGFGSAPKFPQPLVLDFLLGFYLESGRRDVLDRVTLTLRKMAAGGIYDQIGGGFHRYAVDEAWQVPHFEKMLYDNALLARLYLHAYQITGEAGFRRICAETLDFTLREMCSPQGAFYSTLDADSEGREGAFYLWRPDQVRALLADPEAAQTADYFGITAEGNFEGASIPHLAADRPDDEPESLSRSRAALRRARELRPRPGRDEKILTSWNALLLAALAEAARVLDRPDYRQAARDCAAFLLDKMSDGPYLYHSYKDGRKGAPAYLEDYALLIEGLLALHAATFQGRWLTTAIRLAEVMLEQFWDDASGCFYDAGPRHPALFIRPRSLHDGAAPSGSSAASLALLKLSALTGRADWKERARRSLQSALPHISRYPAGHGLWLSALDFYLAEPPEVAVVGPPDSPLTRALLRVLDSAPLIGPVFAALDPADPEAARELPLLQDRLLPADRPAVYICRNRSCLSPQSDPAALRQLILSNKLNHPGSTP